jgi:SAM-dependent methyltransferase
MHDYFISLNRPINILETGCGSIANNGTFASNTYIFSKMIKNMKGGRLTTVDINEDHLNKCKEITKDFSDIIDYKLGDSINILRNLNADFVKSLDLIILDSYDLFLFDPDPSAIHHLQELLSLYTKLNKNCLIAIDDNYLPGTWIAWNWDDGRSEIFETKDKLIGKGMYCNDFLIKNDWIRDPSVIFAGVNIFLYYHKSNFQSHF